MPENSSPAEWTNSPYYQLLYNFFAAEKVTFVRELIGKLKPADGNTLLDAACGTGKYTEIISETGLDVTGVDFSFDDIDKAKQFENERLHFYQHDLRLPFWINYFDYAFHLFTPFVHFKTAREHNNAIRSLSQSLQPGGCLVLDCMNADYEENHLEEIVNPTVGEVAFRITNQQDDEYFYRNIEVTENGMNNHFFTEKVMKLSFENYTEMFVRQGLKIEEVFGDYRLSAYNEEQSPRLIFLAKKSHK